ncbi:M81 family metallopeptidase [Devosia sp. FKR38]|uniref:M81 family metallopeptidase n=1 Tax=Devosia sp. FKR38 TaxID=2562312 RepID=UPI001484C9F5|nr:M81 family metallopeptidase [Devosia sp. FKR38]
MSVRVFIAALGTETNTFSAIPTGWNAFLESHFRRDGAAGDSHYFGGPNRLWRERCDSLGYAVVESISTFAQPSGPTKHSVWAELRDMVLDDLRAAGAIDMVLLHLHGAMVSTASPDCEGELLVAVREIVGPEVVVGVELDLHCHLTERMIAASDVVVLYKEYPHTDVLPRADDLFSICERTRKGDITPKMALVDCRMLAVWRTSLEPMRGLVQEMLASEGSDKIISLSFAHGFPWADVPDVGAKFLAIADGDLAVAEDAARRFAAKIWDLRYDTASTLLTPAAAVEAARSCRQATVFADVSDNAGAGAGSDSTFLLRALIDDDAQKVILGLIWDPVAVRFCFDAGIGATIGLRLGGKTSPYSGAPLDTVVTVKGLVEHGRQPFAGGDQPMGDAVLVGIGGIDVVINSIRTQVFHPEAFTQFGCDLSSYRSIFVKSAQHFYAAFEPVVDAIHFVAAPGVASPEFTTLVLNNAGRPLWPQVDDPFVEVSS